MPDHVRIADEQLRRLARTGDSLEWWEREQVNSAARLHIPLRDPVQVRDVVKALRVLASYIEQRTNSKDPNDFFILKDCRTRIKEMDALINGRKPR